MGTDTAGWLGGGAINTELRTDAPDCKRRRRAPSELGDASLNSRSAIPLPESVAMADVVERRRAGRRHGAAGGGVASRATLQRQ